MGLDKVERDIKKTQEELDHHNKIVFKLNTRMATLVGMRYDLLTKMEKEEKAKKLVVISTPTNGDYKK